jgi:hypothetical protein
LYYDKYQLVLSSTSPDAKLSVWHFYPIFSAAVSASAYFFEPRQLSAAMRIIFSCSFWPDFVGSPQFLSQVFFPVKAQPFLMEVQHAVEHSSCRIRYILHPKGFYIVKLVRTFTKFEERRLIGTSRTI